MSEAKTLRRSIVIGAYCRIVKKIMEGKTEIDELSHDEKKKFVYIYIRFLSLVGAELSPGEYTSFYFTMEEVCKYLTPLDFEGMFPIDKTFNGGRWGMKDYFYTKNLMKELGEDTPLGDNVSGFLYDYQNRHVKMCVVKLMSTRDDIRVKEGKKSAFYVLTDIASFKEGVDTEIVKEKLNHGIDGLEWLVLQTVVDIKRQMKLQVAIVEYDGVDGFIAKAKVALHTEDKSRLELMILRDLLTHLTLLREYSYDNYFKLMNSLYE